MKLKWNKPASEGLGDWLEYIAQDSPLHSFRVKERIVRAAMSLTKYPTKHPPDKFKTSSDGTFRAFTQDSVRISYRVFKTSIHIIRVRHRAQRPFYY